MLFPLTAILLSPLAAHPHQFVDFSLSFRVNETELAGVRVEWFLDEMISAWICDDFKLAAGDTFTGEGFARYVHETFGELEQCSYFAVAEVDGKPLKIYRWQEKVMRILPDRILHFSFFLPLSVPLAPAAKTLSFQFIDESFYIGYALIKGDVEVEGPGAEKCRVITTRTEYDDVIEVILKK